MATLNIPRINPSITRVGFIYDFANDGGSTGTLNSNIFLPANVFCAVFIDVVTTFTGGMGATIDIAIGATSLLATGAIGYVNLGNGDTGGEAFALPGTGFHVTRTLSGAGGQVGFVIGTAALTAGKANVYIEYTTFVQR